MPYVTPLSLVVHEAQLVALVGRAGDGRHDHERAAPPLLRDGGVRDLASALGT